MDYIEKTLTKFREKFPHNYDQASFLEQALLEQEGRLRQYAIKEIEKRIKSLKNRKNYLIKKDSWQTIGEPSTLRDIADYLQIELKKALQDK